METTWSAEMHIEIAVYLISRLKMQFGVCFILNAVIFGKLLEARLLVSSPVLGRSKFPVFFISQRCRINDYEVLSLLIGLSQTWSGRSLWQLLLCSALPCTTLAQGDSSSISPLFCHVATPQGSPLFSKASCTSATGVTSASPIFDIYS